MEFGDRDLSNVFEPKAKESSVNYVINNIKESLLSRQILPGERLPSEMELAKLLSVSRGSIREAMKILAAFGIVEIRRGDGTYVARDVAGNVIFDPLLFSFIISQPALEELKELRLMVEKYIIRLAIQNETQQDLEELRACTHKLKALAAESKQFGAEVTAQVLECEMTFHVHLARMAKNKLIERIYLFILEYFKPYIKKSIENHACFTYEANMPHERILEAMEKRDLLLAECAVEESIEDWGKLITR